MAYSGIHLDRIVVRCMQPLAGGCRLLARQQLQPRLALLLLVLSLAASLPVLQGSSEVFKYGDDPEFAGNDTGTHWTYGKQRHSSSMWGGAKTPPGRDRKAL